MKTIALLGTFALLALCSHTAPAHAAPVVFVASGGLFGNPCTRASPCNLSGAVASVDPGGEIICLDSGPFIEPGIPVSKSFTLDCAGVYTMAHLTIGIQTSGTGHVVRIRNLTFSGALGGEAAIRTLGGGALFLENCLIDNFQVPGVPAIWLQPTTPASQSVVITDTVIANSGTGISIAPMSSGSVRAVIDRSRVVGNNVGIVVDGTGGSGRSVIQINDSLVANNGANGITVIQAGAVINRTASQDNAGNGVLAGPGALIHLGNSTVAGNFLGGLAYNGGQILSYQNNQTKGNGIDNAPSAVLALQ